MAGHDSLHTDRDDAADTDDGAARTGRTGRPGDPAVWANVGGRRPWPKRPPGRRPKVEREILFFAWTIDGTEPTSQEDIFAVDVRTGAVRRLTDESSGVPFISDRDPSWSPDRSRIVHARAGQLVVSTPLGAPIDVLAVEGTTPVWIDDTTVLCTVHRIGGGGSIDRADLVAVDTDSGAQTAISAVDPGEYLAQPAWHPSAGLAAVLTREIPATHAHLTTGLVHLSASAVQGVLAGGAAVTAADVTALTPGTAWDSEPDWSPDGTRLAFSTLRPCATLTGAGTPLLQSEVALLELATPSTIQLVTDDATRDYADGINDGSPAFSPDGKVLAWVRGYEDDWTHIVLQRIGKPATRRTLLGGPHWFRHGLDW